MIQGVLGKWTAGVFFSVTEFEVATFRDLQRKREIVFAKHACVSGLPRLQHVGREPDELTLQIQLVPLSPLAFTVDLRLEKLLELAAQGQEQALVLGFKYMGLFVVQNVEVSHRILHNGVTMSAEVNVTLTEYN